MFGAVIIITSIPLFPLPYPADRHVPTGTLILTKNIGNFGATHITSIYHTRTYNVGNPVSPVLGATGNGFFRTLTMAPDGSVQEGGIVDMRERDALTMALNTGESAGGGGIVVMDPLAVDALAHERGALEIDFEDADAEWLSHANTFCALTNNLIYPEDDSFTGEVTHSVFSSVPLLPPRIVDNRHRGPGGASSQPHRHAHDVRAHINTGRARVRVSPDETRFIRDGARPIVSPISDTGLGHDNEPGSNEIPIYR